MQNSDYELYKNNPTDMIWWVDNYGRVGEWIFTFDKKKYYNMFADYPHNLTADEVDIFDRENPWWADFFNDRK